VNQYLKAHVRSEGGAVSRVGPGLYVSRETAGQAQVAPEDRVLAAAEHLHASASGPFTVSDLLRAVNEPGPLLSRRSVYYAVRHQLDSGPSRLVRAGWGFYALS